MDYALQQRLSPWNCNAFGGTALETFGLNLKSFLTSRYGEGHFMHKPGLNAETGKPYDHVNDEMFGLGS